MTLFMKNLLGGVIQHFKPCRVLFTAGKDPKEGDARLIEGDNESSGRLEIFHNEVWGSVCDDKWDTNRLNNAKVVCNELGYKYVNVAKMYNSPKGKVDEKK